MCLNTLLKVPAISLLIKGRNIQNNFKVISFEVTSLFPNDPLDLMVDVIVKCTYDENEVSTKILKQ